VFDFKISEDGKQLNVNGYPIYPSMGQGLKISQVPTDIPYEVLTTSLHDVTTDLQSVTYNGRYRTFSAPGENTEVIELDLTVLSLRDQSINPGRVHVRLFKGDNKDTGAPGLFIDSVTLRPSHIYPSGLNIKGGPNKFTRPEDSEDPRAGPLHGSDSLSSIKNGPPKIWKFRSEWRTIPSAVEGKLFSYGVRPMRRPHNCGGRQHVHHVDDQSEALRRVMHFGQQVLELLVIPILFCLVAGLTASILGLLLGTFIGWLWIKLFRGGRKGNAGAEAAFMQEAEIGIDSDEKERLIFEEEDVDDEEPLPIYEESEKQ